MTSSPSSPSNDRYLEALAFLYDRINYEKLVGGTSRYPFRLRRMVELLHRLGLGHFLHPQMLDRRPISGHIEPTTAPIDPETANSETANPIVPLVHIAGTKGKGSTAAMVSASLTASGIRTGTFTSPHLDRLEERFRVDGQLCSPEQLVELVDLVRTIDGQMASEAIGAPTFFELTTAIGLLHFHQSECQVVVMEVGLGGRLDSTNVCRPAVSVITSIGLDHQHVLGDTKELIAAEKAGIIKPGVPVIVGVTQSGPRDVIEAIAKDQDSPVYLRGRDFQGSHQPAKQWGSTIGFAAASTPFHSIADISLSLDGEHQGRNAAVAIAALQVLQCECSLSIHEDAIRSAFAKLTCEGRIERYRLPEDVTVLVDAAHNEDSMAALCQTVQHRYRSEHNWGHQAEPPLVFVFGTSADKIAGPMLDQIVDLADGLVLTRFKGNPRFTDPETLRQQVPSSWDKPLVVDPDPVSACRQAVENVMPGSIIVVCGSFFLAAETRQWFAERAIN